MLSIQSCTVFFSYPGIQILDRLRILWITFISKWKRTAKEQEMVGFSSKGWYSKMPSLEHILLYDVKVGPPQTELPGLEAFPQNSRLRTLNVPCKIVNKNSTRTFSRINETLTHLVLEGGKEWCASKSLAYFGLNSLITTYRGETSWMRTRELSSHGLKPVYPGRRTPRE